MLANNRLCAAIAVLALAGCGADGPVRDSGDVVDERVRAPSAGSDEELQVYGVRNPAVARLGREARAAEAEGDLPRAEMLLERALRIDGRDPAILQQMAEIHLASGRLDQAESFARRSFDLGPQVGEICQRSLRTLIVVAERNGEPEQARKARGGLDECRVAPPERF